MKFLIVQEPTNVNVFSKAHLVNPQARALLRRVNMAPGYYPAMQKDMKMNNNAVSVHHQRTSQLERNIIDSSSSTMGKKSYGQLKLVEQLELHTGASHPHRNTEMQLLHNAEHQDIASFPRQAQAQAQYNDVSGRSMEYASAHQKQGLDHHVMEYGHGTLGTSDEKIGQYSAQSDNEMHLTNGPVDIDGHYPTHIDTTKTWPHPTHSNNAPKDGEDSNNRDVALVQSRINPTNQLLRERRLIGSIPAEALFVSKYMGDHNQRHPFFRSGGELGVPDHLNCSVWIRGISKEIPKEHLYWELFKVVSVGPVIGAYINEAGDSLLHHAAKVIFRHPEHAGRLCQYASKHGIQINGENLRVEPNRFGYTEYPRRLHYQSRVVIVEVLNDSNLGIAYWLNFVKSLCVFGIESTRHLSHSTANRMVMEFRFARIFGQAQVLLQGIKSSQEFKGKVSVRYVPDVACDLPHN
ncbi:hypothetical protein SBOR_9755 [Sclerotinia borealis F-4128]|uniref:RRM domain-containing protein n=1 Tax=Sclerotinia borealis (strain F-4128) TaxID=1432307 RepID=W9C4N4_SCLBF|nr:hypothetical protein SBOR_9755 [Sclerotinia borealis F-4128]